MPGKDLCLLSIDGGGVRGLSSLHILKQLMEIVDPNQPPKPCEYFDMIGGTSTGGLMAIMLGRLRMDIDDCINAYVDLSDRIFKKRRHRVTIKGAVQGRFDTEELERVVKDIVVQSGLSEDALFRNEDDIQCKARETADTMQFTSYPSRGSSDLLRTTKIWEVARATSAASSFFDPIKIGKFGEEFVDGATGANNPVRAMWSEAKHVFLGPRESLESNLKCLVSIGTGVPSLEPFGDKMWDIARTLKRIATETRKTAESFHQEHSELDEGNQYFRFNVPHGLEKIGLEDAAQKNSIIAATRRYVQTQAVMNQMRLCGKNLMERENNNAYKVNFELQGIPVINKFVPRNDEVQQIEHALLPRAASRSRRKVFVLHGLGGIGKTQLAIEFAREHQEIFTAIFWLNGSTHSSVQQSIASIASRLPKGQISEMSRIFSQGSTENLNLIIKEVQQWFSQQGNDRWLLVFDNVDRDNLQKPQDPDAFDVEAYFPRADQGSILITTRLSRLEKIGNCLKLARMSEDQGKSLLEEKAGRPLEGSTKLVEQVGGLPLALAQAGSYIGQHQIGITEYIKTYQEMWSDLFSEKSSSSPHEYSRSILTTWELSFQQIRRSNEDAACMLQLWTCLSPRDIWYELFIPILDDTEEIVPEWFERCMHNKVTFRQTAKVLLDYSLAEAEAGNSAYSVHPVVHDWCFNQELKDREATTSLAIHIVSSSIPRENDPEYWLLQRRLLPHCDRIYRLIEKSAGFDWKNDLKTDSLSSPCETLGNLYTDQGKMAEAEEMYMRALKGYEKARGPEHTATLTTANNLGNLYANQGKIAEAEEMFRKAKTHGQNIQQQESTNADIMSGQTTDSLSPYNRSEKEKNDIKGWWTRKKMRILKHRSRNQEDT